MTQRQAIKKLDNALRDGIIRPRDGKVCITCRKKCTGKNRHAGHFRKRGKMSTRFDPRNVNIQCAYCNTYLDGNEGVYAIELDKTYTRGTAEELIEISKILKNWDTKDLIKLIGFAKAQDEVGYWVAYFKMVEKEVKKAKSRICER